jgi:hypothetical protein
VLDGTANVSYVQPVGGYQQTPPVVPLPSSVRVPEPTSTPAPLATPQPPAPTALPPTPRYEDGRPAIPGVLTVTETNVSKPPPAPSGQDSFQAEQLARRMNCAFSTSSSLVGKGPGYETYGVRCGNGETIVIRCEFGNCRVLK